MDAILLENAKKMLDSGISQEEVMDMLVSLGYSKEEAQSAIKASKGETIPEKEKEELVIEEKKPLVIEKPEKTKEYAETAELASTMAMNVVDNATRKLDEHKEHMENLNSNITKTYEKLESVSFDKMNNVNSDIVEIKKALADLTAKTNVTLDLMKKILENQRELILKMN